MYLGRLSYQLALQEQSQWIQNKRSDSFEVFCFESEPVITMGLRAKAEQDLLQSTSLPVLPVDRGGETTYHGPGQLLIFPSVHLPQWNLSVRKWVALLLDVTVDFLREHDIPAGWSEAKPGIFTKNGKIASVGLKIKNGWSHHGLSLNVKGSVEPFSNIRACGVHNAPIDQMSRWKSAEELDLSDLGRQWGRHFESQLKGR